jgi:hypothetical protein
MYLRSRLYTNAGRQVRVAKFESSGYSLRVCDNDEAV